MLIAQVRKFELIVPEEMLKISPDKEAFSHVNNERHVVYTSKISVVLFKSRVPSSASRIKLANFLVNNPDKCR